ncbi:MAG: hexokinase [Termitinemataceae bacterium]|jgi:hexokinase|nr:MAG: hexokinase [Termitinemataceae bacterium]
MNIKKIDDFARFYGFHYASIDEDALVDEFRIAMERGLRGETSSLPMIPSHIVPASSVPAGKLVVALDAGGTNLRVSRIRFNESGHPEEVLTQRAPMPGTHGRLGANEFFDELAAACVPCFEGSPRVEGMGFCFSYEMKVTESGDGIPIALSKEVDAPEIIGKSLKEGLKAALLKRNIPAPERIVFLNDTTATLLSGITQIPPQKFNMKGSTLAQAGKVFGFILGTGINTAYPETSIPKTGFNSEDAPQIVVAESGGWDFPWQGAFDRGFDATTKVPGYHTLEKAASGAYLGPLSLYILKQAIREKIICFDKSAELLAMEKLETRDLNEFLHNPFSSAFGSFFKSNEMEALSATLYLESILTERAALLAAGIVAGTIEHTGTGYDPLSPARIAVEGTTFARYHHIRESFESRLHSLLCRKKARFYIVSTVEQASLFGAAVAAACP